MIQTAKKYYQSGLSIIPIGEKKLPIGSWKKNQTELIEPAFTSCIGIGIVCGKVSGGVECIDIDSKYDLTGNLFDNYKNLINEADKNLLRKLVVQSTPSGGYHFVYRCEIIEGNKKLANRHTTEAEKAENPKDKIRVLIETRGEGGYFMVAPSNGYKVVYGDLNQISILSALERETLFVCARTLNEVFEAATTAKTQQKTLLDNVSPFEDWNNRGDVLSFLEMEGWVVKLRNGAKNLLLRPQGTGMWSADWNDEKRIFYVFTSSSEFEQNKGYNATQVLAKLKFNDDFSECAKWLLKEGYGSFTSDKKEYESTNKASQKPIEIKSTIDTNDSHVADESEINDYLSQWRNGTFVKGLSTGIEGLDKYFLFKRGNFNVVNGIDNIGKSTGMWYLCLLSALFHDWKWLIYSNENRAGAVSRKLIEFYWGINVRSQTEAQYTEAYNFVKEHFTIISNKKMYNYMDLLKITTIENAKKKHDGLLVDPYNSLMISLSDNSKLSTHEYHYQAASEMQLYSHKEDTCIYLSCHVITSALREQGKAPKKGDTEGGAKFANKADDFMTFHRLPYDPEKMNEMQIHVRKIKEVETGGGYTPEGQPFILRLKAGFASYEDEYGFDPIEQWRFRGKEALKGKQEKISYPDKYSTPKIEQPIEPTIKPNKDFDAQKPTTTLSNGVFSVKEHNDLY
jgi:hypothetical protein